MKNRQVVPVSLVALCAWIGGPAEAADVARVQTAQPTRLDVSAEGMVSAVPDLAVVSAGATSDAATAAQAIGETARRVAAMRAALKDAGIAERDIQTAQVSLNPQYRYDNGQPPVLTGYQATTMLNVRFRDVRRAGQIIDLLVARGANQIGGPSFQIDNPDPLLDEARRKAVAAARARADLYAQATGLHVRRIVSISEGGGIAPPPVMPMPMLRVAEGRMADTSLAPGDQKLAVTVAVTFELD